MSGDEIVDELRRRLARYPRDRYPVQHATTQFHLGQALLGVEQPQAAVDALRASLQWFPPPMVAERAKVLNLLGAALRALGHLDAAAEAFRRAGDVFAEQGLTAEHGAAVFNLGLVLRDAERSREAADTLARARQLLAAAPVGSRATAALHHGGALLEAGSVDAAIAALGDAVELSEAAGDRETIGGAANTLGLAQLAAGRAGAAAESFGLAVAAHPRSVRPVAFAMAKANLALAYEQAGHADGARLAVRQALAVVDLPPPIVAQAQATLERLGPAIGSVLLAVLDAQPPEDWPSTVRDEAVRWAGLDPADRRAEAVAWVEGVAQRTADAEALHHVWLAALLELPPADLDALVTATVEAVMLLDPVTGERFRSAVARAMAVFPVPQLLRLRDRFNTLATELGQEPAWG
jgi:tetratricopeptide (TPR) repeat protein